MTTVEPSLTAFCQLSVIRQILTNQALRCWADGGFEKAKKSLQTVFARLAFFPTRPYRPCPAFFPTRPPPYSP